MSEIQKRVFSVRNAISVVFGVIVGVILLFWLFLVGSYQKNTNTVSLDDLKNLGVPHAHADLSGCGSTVGNTFAGSSSPDTAASGGCGSISGSGGGGGSLGTCGGCGGTGGTGATF